MRPQVFEESGNITLHGLDQQTVLLVQKLGKRLQIAQVGFARERTQSFFHAQVRLVLLQQRQIWRAVHPLIIRAVQLAPAPRRSLPNLIHQGLKVINANRASPLALLNVFRTQTWPAQFVMEPLRAICPRFGGK
jgi:hypothetical protein